MAHLLTHAFTPTLYLKTLTLILLLIYVHADDTDTDTMALQQEFSKNSAIFANNVYNVLTALKPNENIVFSPFSIQTCAAMARVGAEGETAEQLDRGLGLVSKDVEKMAGTFKNVLAAYQDSGILKIANKIYVMKGYTVEKKFNEILSTNFFSSADLIDFAQNTAAAQTINSWVESKTNNLIRDLISPDALSDETRLVLLNAIHFKGKWVHQFRKEATREDDFYLNDVDKVRVQMMNVKESFLYADLPELDATVLEMPYENSDLSMLVILPNSRTGLKGLEDKLKTTSLSDITRKMYKTKVIVKFPKFKAEFSIELNEAFKKLGMTRMFGNDAEFSKMLEEAKELKVSKVIHKAFIEVNEEGTEAAAATAVNIRMKRCLVPEKQPKEFIVEHPYVYFINHLSVQEPRTSIPLFMGSVATFDVCASPPHSHSEL